MKPPAVGGMIALAVVLVDQIVKAGVLTHFGSSGVNPSSLGPFLNLTLQMNRGISFSLFARDYPHDYPEVEAVLMLHAHRLRMTEVPVRMRHRETGRSSITTMRSAYYMIKVSLALLVGLLRRRPVVDSGGPAAVSATRVI